MRLFLLISLTMLAFAANSVLTRVALSLDQIGPAAFSAIRMTSGAVFLMILCLRHMGVREVLNHATVVGAGSLLLYVLGFSFAYVTLETGTGALILFGGVQITMFLGAIITGTFPGLWRWVGCCLGLLGLSVLFLPGTTEPPSWAGAALMAAAALGWGIYSLKGSTTHAPLAATAANFTIAAPFVLITWSAVPDTLNTTVFGICLALASGMLASGLGYALWYSLLPSVDKSLAAIAQLTVPVIAALMGMILLAEPFTVNFVLASALVLGGVVLAVIGPSARFQK